MAEHNDTGKLGEELAARFLESEGYVIRERDWKSGRRDIDIIAIDRDTLVFVEVKTRGSGSLIRPEEAVDEAKLGNLALAASSYVRVSRLDLPLRFDIVTVTGIDTGELRFSHAKDVLKP